MRKFVILFFVAILLLTGCSGDTPPPMGGDGSDVIELTDRFFILQMEEINLNIEEYLGRTIRYEGMFRSVHWPPTDRYYHYVIRYTDSCCGPGGAIGFEVRFEDGSVPVEENAWVAVTGVLGEYEEDGVSHLQLMVTSIATLEERGNEFVAR